MIVLPAAVKLPLQFDVTRMQLELRSITADQWVSHYKPEDYEGEWSGVALRSIGGAVGQLRAVPRAHPLYLDTPLLARGTYFREILTLLRCPLNAVRLLRLAAGSEIREHADDGFGLEAGELRLHLPVQTTDAVAFYLAGSRVPLGAGECWYLDLSLPHRVVNHGAIDRVHLVVDCERNPWLDTLLMAGSGGVVAPAG